MKIIRSISVDLINYDTFEPLTGAVEFEEIFKPFQGQTRSQFDFFKEEDLAQAIKQLTTYNLDYKSYYRIELDSNDELKNYPAVYIAFNAPKNPVLDVSENSISVNSKISKKNFHSHVYPWKNEEFIVLSKKGMEFFKKHIPEITFVEIKDNKGEMDYYLFDKIKTLNSPRLYPEFCNVEPSPTIDGTYIIKNHDGRFNLTEDSLKEINNAVFMREKSFSLNGKKYACGIPSYACTGEFAYKFSQHFNLDKDMCSLFIPTLMNA